MLNHYRFISRGRRHHDAVNFPIKYCPGISPLFRGNFHSAIMNRQRWNDGMLLCSITQRDKTFLDWPFFDDRHRALAAEVEDWAGASLAHVDHADADAACRALVRAMGDAGILTHSAVDPSGGALDVRSLCLIRETLARHDGLADFAFAMQGLGMGAVSLRNGVPDSRSRRVARA